MAKKKKTSKKEKKEFNYSVELIGLLLIVIGIIGFGFGPVGAMIKKFAMFLVGEWWALILVLLLYLGFVMIIWRKLPNFFTTKLMGFYILILVVLTASHYTFIKTYSGSEIISKTMDSYQSRISTMGTSASIFTTGQESISIGGGIVGLVHIEDLSVARIKTPHERIKIGQKLEVMVKSIDKESGKIVLSYKELLGTWEDNVQNFKEKTLQN